jgi:hypothetical protein
MSVVVRVQGRQVSFYSRCVVCLQPSQKIYELEKAFTYGRRTIPIKLQVPMCAHHHEAAAFRSSAEQTVERIGLVAGILVGLLVAFGLIVYWNSIGQGFPMLNIPIAVFSGLGFFLIVWAATAYRLAPALAPAEIKAARRAINPKKYWPGQDILELEFANDQAAQLFIQANQSIILK